MTHTSAKSDAKDKTQFDCGPESELFNFLMNSLKSTEASTSNTVQETPAIPKTRTPCLLEENSSDEEFDLEELEKSVAELKQEVNEKRNKVKNLKRKALYLMKTIRLSKHDVLYKSSLAGEVSYSASVIENCSPLHKLSGMKRKILSSETCPVSEKSEVNINQTLVDDGLFRGKPRSTTQNALKKRADYWAEGDRITELEASLTKLAKENYSLELRKKILDQSKRTLHCDLLSMRHKIESDCTLTKLMLPMFSSQVKKSRVSKRSNICLSKRATKMPLDHNKVVKVERDEDRLGKKRVRKRKLRYTRTETETTQDDVSV